MVRSWGEKRMEPKLKNHVDLVDLLELSDSKRGIHLFILGAKAKVFLFD